MYGLSIPSCVIGFIYKYTNICTPIIKLNLVFRHGKILIISDRNRVLSGALNLM